MKLVIDNFLSFSMPSDSQQTNAKTPSSSAIDGQVSKVFPNDLNAHSTVFGGLIMAECDRLALVVAERHSGYVCVTASVDSMHFMAPARKGDTLIFSASINNAWRSSMEIGIRVEAENSYSGDRRHIVSAYFTFVALDENNKPIEVPDLTLTSDMDKRRAKEAEIRRKLRLDTRDAIEANRSE